jgi:hypothetical protein
VQVTVLQDAEALSSRMNEFVEYIQQRKVVELEDLACQFNLKTKVLVLVLLQMHVRVQ